MVRAVQAGAGGAQDLVPRLVGEEIPRIRQTASELAPLVPELAPGIAYMAEAFSRAFVQRVVQRLAGIGEGVARGSGEAASMAALGFLPQAGRAGGIRPQQIVMDSIGSRAQPTRSWGTTPKK